MKFFIPGATDEQSAERVYGATKEFLSTELGASFSDDRIYRLNYVHDGTRYEAVVGTPHALNGEPVIAILYEPGRRLYHVCTPNRGVLGGMSILVGGHTVRGSEHFEAA